MADESTLNKINRLMALAMNEGATESERQLALSRAQGLRLKYTVEDWELRKHDASKADKIVIEQFEVGLPLHYASHINYLVAAVASFCNVRYTWKDYYKTSELIGYRSDVEYVKQLWFVVYGELARNLFPSWSGERSFEQNVYHHVKGGYKWKDIAAAANRAGVEVKWPDNGRLKRAYHNWCKKIDEEPTPHTQRHEAFRVSYVRSYQSTVSQRLRKMKDYAEGESGDSGEKFALAVMDNAAKVEAEFYRMYPQYDPEVRAKRWAEAAEAERARREGMTQAQRDAEDARLRKEEARARRNYDKIRNREYDANGWQHGRNVGRDVDLTMGKNHVAPNRSEIER